MRIVAFGVNFKKQYIQADNNIINPEPVGKVFSLEF